ncbi:RNA polymerase sigma factor [Agaribacter marinus]|uniref:ECF RNA polymerase sigma-E factor n=1 Tax=Agaribacter marinus TaxID=1431249 RepID=A0AA37WIN4_9ALTE|nr:sigma-70 family RNA polymerase sigma factor [Agaribacter marinus]GLR69589.1 ECF RNA polymerase sigma-E factor [Agaribacter marinus]
MFSRSDQQLVEKALTGNKKAWLELISRYEQSIFNYAMRMTSQSHDAKDLMQEIFISVFNSLHSFRGEGSFKAWLFRIAHFRSMDFYRRKKPNVSLDDSPELIDSRIDECMGGSGVGSVNIESQLIGQQSQKALLNTMQQLPFNQKVVIELKFFGQFTFDEIAQQLGVSTNTVKSRLYAALGKLKTILEVEHV